MRLFLLILITFILPSQTTQAMGVEQNKALTIIHTCLTVNSVADDLDGLVYWADALNRLIAEDIPTDKEVDMAVARSNERLNVVQSAAQLAVLKEMCDAPPIDYRKIMNRQ